MNLKDNPVYNYFWAKAICKKYGIKGVFFTKNSGSYKMRRDNQTVISVDLFRDNFKFAFLHEVGHHVDAVKRKNWVSFLRWEIYMKGCPKFEGFYCNGYPYTVVLKGEMKASRFASKVTKGESTDFLIKAFRTYTNEGFNVIKSENLSDYVDYCVKMEHLITKY